MEENKEQEEPKYIIDGYKIKTAPKSICPLKLHCQIRNCEGVFITNDEVKKYTLLEAINEVNRKQLEAISERLEFAEKEKIFFQDGEE